MTCTNSYVVVNFQILDVFNCLMLGESLNSSVHKLDLIRLKRKGNLVSSEVFAVKHAFGRFTEDESDDEQSVSFISKYNEASPGKRIKLKEEYDIEKAGKIGPVGTFFTLVKGFVASGILFLPKGWRNGGWLFSSVTLFFSSIFT